MIDIKLGDHKPEEREAFLKKWTDSYIFRHPLVNKRKARRYARVKWARKVNKEQKAKQHVNPIKGAEKL